MMQKLSEMKDSIQVNFVELREKFKSLYEEKLSSMNITHLEFDLKTVFEELNEKIHSFKENILDKVE